MRWSSLLDLLFPAACVECGAAGSGLCEACYVRAEPIAFRIDDLACMALGTYDGVLRRAVLSMKSGRRDVAEALGALLAPLIAAQGVDLLVPVPTTRARRRRRGFDQAYLLARVASAHTSSEVVVALQHAERGSQHGRSRSERLRAVGRFVRTSASFCEGARVLLVDDVATTGATLRDSARELRAAGVRVAGAIVVARA